MPPLRGLGFLVTCCYKHAVATRLKRFLKSSRFPRSIRFGWETEPTGPRAAAVIFLNRLGNRTYRGMKAPLQAGFYSKAYN